MTQEPLVREAEVAAFRDAVLTKLTYAVGKDPDHAFDHDWFEAIALAARDHMVEHWMDHTRQIYRKGQKRVYYLSLEFLIGRLLYDSLSNLGLLDVAREALTELGVDYIAVAKFDNYFRSLNAEAFAELLKLKLNAHSLVLGDDFHFGKNRQGNSEFLRAYGFQVTNLTTVALDGERVSSTRIRQTLQAGDLALAAKLLGRPYSITGRVQYGDQIGRTLDFPTINVALNRHKPCLKGIYGVEVMCETLSLKDKVKADNPEKSGIAGHKKKPLNP